jgi:uncharacterized membrane protein
MDMIFEKRVATKLVILAFALAMVGCGGGTPSSAQRPTVPAPSNPPPAAPTASISASPSTIVQGGSATLTWQTTNATDISIDVLGAVQASGSQSVTPTNTTTYTLTAKGSGGTQTAAATVTVTAPPSPTPPPPPTPPSAWTVTELPPLFGETDSVATAINDAGDVVGNCASKGDQHGCLWKADDPQNPIDLGANFRTANAINNAEQVVGQSDNGHALLWPDMLELPEPDGFNSSIANGINDAGVIVGTLVAIDPNGLVPDKSEGFTWTREGGFHLFPDCSQALAINAGGVVVGMVMNPDPNVPFIGGATECGGPVLFPNTGAATAINSSGVAVGYTVKSATEADVNEAMEFPSTRISPGTANGINDNGWVVGTVPGAVGNFPTAFIWSPTTDLMTIPGMITSVGINGSGAVTGLKANVSFSQRAAVAVGQ